MVLAMYALAWPKCTSVRGDVDVRSCHALIFPSSSPSDILGSTATVPPITAAKQSSNAAVMSSISLVSKVPVNICSALSQVASKSMVISKGGDVRLQSFAWEKCSCNRSRIALTTSFCSTNSVQSFSLLHVLGSLVGSTGTFTYVSPPLWSFPRAAAHCLKTAGVASACCIFLMASAASVFPAPV